MVALTIIMRRRRCVAAAAFLIACSSCGIFDPRPSEAPELSGTVDPLNFAAIMDNTGEQFTRLQYEDLFNESLLYEDINSGIYQKNQVIQRLRQIHIQHQNIAIVWQGGGIWKNTGNDTIIVSSIGYRAHLSGNPGAAPDYMGTATFVVVKKQEWHICLWRDTPGDNRKSFFSPG